MQKFKTPISRLARLFRQERNNWKERALEKQKKNRALEIKVRDLLASRDKWKERAKQAEEELLKLQKREEQSAGKIVSEEVDLNFKNDDLLKELKAKGHHYSLEIIQLVVYYFIEGSISLRGIVKILKNPESNLQKIPHFTTIRKWLIRIGLYELQRQKKYGNDWIFIMDLTVELGKQKALVILGVSQEHLKEKVFPLQKGLCHEDVEVLAVEIMDSTKGELIEEKLNKLTQTVGNPSQIVADNGSDLACGIKLYQQKNPEVIYTHDVTHAMALILKHELFANEKYQSFLKHCHQCRQELQQTELSFLSPPAQRSQCRYFNVEKLVDWAIKLLESPWSTLIKLVPNIEENILLQKLGDKLGWLLDYQSELRQWSLMVEMTRTLETQLKHCGLNQESLAVFEEKLSSLTDSSLLNFQQNILDYLKRESDKISNENTFLATSDIIESLFGKYKSFSIRSPLKQISQLLLMMVLSSINLTTSVLKQALETVRFVDVEVWAKLVFGPSMLSKRKILFSTKGKDMKSA